MPHQADPAAAAIALRPIDHMRRTAPRTGRRGRAGRVSSAPSAKIIFWGPAGAKTYPILASSASNGRPLLRNRSRHGAGKPMIGGASSTVMPLSSRYGAHVPPRRWIARTAQPGAQPSRGVQQLRGPPGRRRSRRQGRPSRWNPVRLVHERSVGGYEPVHGEEAALR